MRTCLRFAAAVFLFSSLAAPALAKGPGRFGVRGGVNFSAFGGEFGEAVEPDNRIAPNIAAVYEIPLAEKLAFHGELAWSGKGGRAVFAGPEGPDKIEWRFDYIEVPLLLRGRFGSMGKVTPFFELGPSIGITLSGKLETGSIFFSAHDVKDDMKAFDFGWGAGGGLEFPVGPGRLGLEARYTRGFSDLFDLEDNFSTINQSWTVALSTMR